MDKEFKEINRGYLLYPIVTFVAGTLMGVGLCLLKQSKEYPITVRCYWSTDGVQSWPSMDADSVKGDTIYKDGLNIVNKNITNIEFK
jgi:hypothetical protein